MIYIYPDYYKKFKCVAQDCIDTCCSGWQIVIDEESIEKYLKETGEYWNTLQKNIDWKEAVFQHDRQGKCAFLREDMLCDMYAHMGKDSLCTTCREYPRHTEEFENVRERSLSLSCPEVAKILMNTTSKVTFLTVEDEKEEVFEDFDDFLFSNLVDIREEMMIILQDRTMDLSKRIKKVLWMGASAQRHYDEGSLISWKDWEEEDRVCVKKEYELLKKQSRYLVEELELLYPDWENVLVESFLLLFGEGEEEYFKNKGMFLEWWEKGTLTPLDIVLEQILVYFIFVYLPGAVYDENIIGKVDSAVGHVVEIFMLLMARWIKKKEKFGMEDLIELVYRYSREIEHSDKNLERVEVLNWFDR